MKKLEVLNKNVNSLNIDNEILDKLHNLNLYTIEDLWNVNSKYLKDNKFSNSDIINIKIKLQLLGLDLNNKIY